MKRKDLKNKIKAAFIEETPSHISPIRSRCHNVIPVENEVKGKNTPIYRRIGFSLAAVMVFIFGFLIGNYEPVNNVEVLAKEASIYLDVNPSVEIQVDKHNL